jgi:DNA-binding CsgD family transcriptional regulator
LLALDLSEDAHRYQALLLLERTFNASCGGFYVMGTDGKPGSYVLDGLEPTLLHLYLGTYRRLDPLDPEKYFFSPMPKVVRLVDTVASMEEFEHTEYYREFLRLCNMHHEMDAYLAWGGRLLGGFFVARPKTRPAFSDDELKLLARVAEPLAIHLFRCLLLHRLRAVDSSLKSALHLILPRGSFLLDDDLVCIFADPDAVACLGIREGDRWTNPLVQLFRHRLGGPGVAQTSFYLKDGRQVSVFAAPSCSEGVPVIVGHVGNGRTVLRDRWHTFAERYGLTHRELQIAWQAAAGRSNRHIATDLGISELTVKTHLKNIFKKVGVSSRTELAAMVWQSGTGFPTNPTRPTRG